MQTITITASHSRRSYREGKQYKSPGMAKFRSRIAHMTIVYWEPVGTTKKACISITVLF